MKYPKATWLWLERTISSSLSHAVNFLWEDWQKTKTRQKGRNKKMAHFLRDQRSRWLARIKRWYKYLHRRIKGSQKGDLVSWESQGVMRFEKRKVTGFSKYRDYIFVEGSNTGIPSDEVVIDSRAPKRKHKGKKLLNSPLWLYAVVFMVLTIGAWATWSTLIQLDNLMLGLPSNLLLWLVAAGVILLVVFLLTRTVEVRDPKYRRYAWSVAKLVILLLAIFFLGPKFMEMWGDWQRDPVVVYERAPAASQVTTRYVTATREGRRVRITPEGDAQHAFLIASIPDESYRFDYITAYGERGTAKCLKEQMCNLPGNIAEVVLFPLSGDSLKFEITTYPK